MKTCSMKSGKAGTTDEECEDKTPWTQEELKALANAHVTCCLKLLEAKKSTSLADMTGKKAILDSIMKETKELLPSFSRSMKALKIKHKVRAFIYLNDPARLNLAPSLPRRT